MLLDGFLEQMPIDDKYSSLLAEDYLTQFGHCSVCDVMWEIIYKMLKKYASISQQYHISL